MVKACVGGWNVPKRCFVVTMMSEDECSVNGGDGERLLSKLPPTVS